MGGFSKKRNAIAEATAPKRVPVEIKKSSLKFIVVLGKQDWRERGLCISTLPDRAGKGKKAPVLVMHG